MKYLTICMCLGLTYAAKTEELPRNTKETTHSKILRNKDDSKKVKRYGINLDGTLSNYYDTIEPLTIKVRIPYDSVIHSASERSNFGFENGFPGFQNDFSTVNIGSEIKYPTVLRTVTNNGFDGILNLDRSYDVGLRTFGADSYSKLQNSDKLINSALNTKSGLPVSIEQARLEFSQESNGRASQFKDTVSSTNASTDSKTKKRSFTIEQVPEVSSFHRSGPLVASDIPSVDELNKIFDSAAASKVSSNEASRRQPKLEDDDEPKIEERGRTTSNNTGTVSNKNVETNTNERSESDSLTLATNAETNENGSILEAKTNEKDEIIDIVPSNAVGVLTSKLSDQDNSEPLGQTINKETKSSESGINNNHESSDTLSTINSSFTSDTRNNNSESEAVEKPNEPSLLELITTVSSNPVKSDADELESRSDETDIEQASDDTTNNNSGFQVETRTSKLSDQDSSSSIAQTILEESKSSGSEDIINGVVSDSLATTTSITSDNTNNISKSEAIEKTDEPSILDFLTMVSSNPLSSNVALESRNSENDVKQPLDFTSNSGFPLNNLKLEETESNYKEQTSKQPISESEETHSSTEIIEITTTSESTASPDFTVQYTKTETEAISSDVESAAELTSPTTTEQAVTTTEKEGAALETVSTVIDAESMKTEAITTIAETETTKTEATFTSIEFNSINENS